MDICNAIAMCRAGNLTNFVSSYIQDVDLYPLVEVQMRFEISGPLQEFLRQTINVQVAELADAPALEAGSRKGV